MKTKLEPWFTEWRPLQDEGVLARFREVLLSWEGTPYREGQQMKRQGVDCVRFVVGVSDEMRGRRTTLQRLPADRSLHNKEGAESALRTILRTCAPLIEVTNGKVEPGDTFVTAPLGGGPGHGLLAGFDPFTLWHVDRAAGVVRTGAGLQDHRLVKIYRPFDKHLWKRVA